MPRRLRCISDPGTPGFHDPWYMLESLGQHLLEQSPTKPNVKLSTGSKTDAGKAAVLQNATSHGLSSARFFFFPHKNPEEFAALIAAAKEHDPATPSEKFLVTEMARAQWKLTRIEHIDSGTLPFFGSNRTGDAEPASLQRYGRSLPDGPPRHRLDQLSNRLTRILSEVHKLNHAG